MSDTVEIFGRYLKPLHNTPAIITDRWLEDIKKVAEESAAETNTVLIEFKNRKLSNVNADINIRGMVLIKEEVALVLEASDDIGETIIESMAAVTVSTNDPGEETFHYRPLFKDIHADELLSIRPSYQYMSYPTSGVGAIVIRVSDEGKLEILLARRTKGPLSYINKLSNFGGAVELGETTWEALRRELKEEINLDLPEEADQPICFDQTIVDYLDVKYHAYSTTFAVVLKDNQDVKNMEPHKARNFGWYSLESILEIPDECTTLLLDSIDAFKNNLLKKF